VTDAKLPLWWDNECDFALLYGVHTHGFGNYDAIRGDDEMLSVFAAAARAGGVEAEAQFLASVKAADEGRAVGFGGGAVAAAAAADGGGVGGVGGGGGGADPTRRIGATKHNPTCGCFVCKFKRRGAGTAGGDGGGESPVKSEVGGAGVTAEEGVKGEGDDGGGGDEEMEKEEADDEGEGEGEGEESEDESVATEDEAEKRAEEESAKELKKELAKARRKEMAKSRRRRHHDGASGGEPNAWPSSETLTHRVKRLADKLGPVSALRPADPPWVALVLGRERKRKRQLDAFGGGAAGGGGGGRAWHVLLATS